MVSNRDLRAMEEGEFGVERDDIAKLSPSSTEKTALPDTPPTTPTPSSTSISKPDGAATSGLPEAGRPQWPRSWASLIITSLAQLLKRLQRQPSYHVPINVRSLDNAPRGYPSLATFLDSDENFMIYRRFGYLQARLLLDKQDEMRKLEKKLEEMDSEDFENKSKRLITRDLKKRDAEPRQELFKAIEEKFCEYSNILTAAQTLMAFNRPAASDYKSVANYVRNKEPVVEEERQWIYLKEDMITLRAGREHALLDDGIERLFRLFHCRAIKWLFCSKETQMKSHGEEVYYTRSRIDFLVNGIITVMILVLLVVPVYILYHLINDVDTSRAYAICIGVLLVFTLAFSAVLSLFTRAKRHEILAAAAAYCAVLVVFLGNVGPQSGRSH